MIISETKIDGLIRPSEEEAVGMLQQFYGVEGAPEMIKPLSYKINLAVKKGLCQRKGFNDKYLNMQALYRKALERYLSEELSLKEFDDMLATSDLRFIPIRNDRENFYQKYSTFDFTYIYLRDNVPIERLSKDDLTLLEACINAGKADITDELLDLVARTYPIITLAYEQSPVDSPILYSNDGQKIAPNTALVFEIGHSVEWDEEGDFVDTVNEGNKDDYLEDELIPLMETKLSEELGREVVVFIDRH